MRQAVKPDSDVLETYARTRDLRDQIRDARDKCLCERHEGVQWVDGLPEPQSGQPCWKAARQWDNGRVDEWGKPVRFYFDPPIGDWCATCRNRQALTEQLRAAVRDHAAAKRAVLQRGRKLVGVYRRRQG